MSNLRQEIVSAFAAAGSATIPDTSRAATWLTKGYDPAICLATISELLARNPNARSLAYFEPAIADAHAPPPAGTARAPPAKRFFTPLDGLVANARAERAAADAAE